jgi:hypothetical protein
VILLRQFPRDITVTNHQKPSHDAPTSDDTTLSPLEELRGSVLFYIDPLEPVGLEDWEALKDMGDE